MAVYFFHGDEDYNIELELEKMVSKLNPDFKSMNFQVLDNPVYSTLITALRTPPMMFGKPRGLSRKAESNSVCR